MSAGLRPESSPLGREVVTYVVHHTNPKRKVSEARFMP